jgi:outer membrane lipoprotein SlyB
MPYLSRGKLTETTMPSQSRLGIRPAPDHEAQEINMYLTRRLFVLALIALLGACASSTSGSAYSRSQTRQAQTVQMGSVESVRIVKIEGTKTPVGTATGAVVGGVLGNELGGGRGNIVTTVLGAVAGGVAGSAAEEGITRKDGLEITVKLDSGGLIAITQEADEQFRQGDRVRVLQGGDATRVTH